MSANAARVMSLSFRESCARAAEAIANGWSPFPEEVMAMIIDAYWDTQLELPLV